MDIQNNQNNTATSPEATPQEQSQTQPKAQPQQNQAHQKAQGRKHMCKVKPLKLLIPVCVAIVMAFCPWIGINEKTLQNSQTASEISTSQLGRLFFGEEDVSVLSPSYTPLNFFALAEQLDAYAKSASASGILTKSTSGLENLGSPLQGEQNQNANVSYSSSQAPLSLHQTANAATTQDAQRHISNLSIFMRFMFVLWVIFVVEMIYGLVQLFINKKHNGFYLFAGSLLMTLFGCAYMLIVQFHFQDICTTGFSVFPIIATAASLVTFCLLALDNKHVLKRIVHKQKA